MGDVVIALCLRAAQAGDRPLARLSLARRSPNPHPRNLHLVSHFNSGTKSTAFSSEANQLVCSLFEYIKKNADLQESEI